MASFDRAGLLCYWSPCGRKLDFVRRALCTSASPTAPHLFTALHSWQVSPPSSGRGGRWWSVSGSDTGVPALDILLQRCTVDGSEHGAAEHVLRLPLDAWANPAALRSCTSPKPDSLLVNGRRFLTALPALSALTPYCEACAGGGEIRSNSSSRWAGFGAVEELWSAVAANVAEHHQPPEEVLLLMLVLNAARLAGDSAADLGRLPSLAAYIQLPDDGPADEQDQLPQGAAEGVEGAGEGEGRRLLLPAEERALALVAAVVMQVAQLVRGWPPVHGSPATCLQLAALRALELRPQLANWGGDDPIERLIEASTIPVVVAEMGPAWLLSPLPHAALDVLCSVLYYHPDREESSSVCTLGVALLETALDTACSDSADSSECGPPAEPAEDALWHHPAVQAAEDVFEGLWLATLRARRDGFELLASVLHPAELAASTQDCRPAAGRQGSSVQQRSKAGSARTMRDPAHHTARGDLTSETAPGSSSAGPTSPAQRVAAGRWLLGRAMRYLEALPRAHLARAQDFYTPATSALCVPSSAPAAREPAYASAASSPHTPSAWARLPHGSGRTRLLVHSATAQSDASLAHALNEVLKVLELVMLHMDDRETAERCAYDLGQVLAPLLANPTYCHDTHRLIRALTQTLFAGGPHAPERAPAMAWVDDAASAQSPLAGRCVWEGLLAGLAACGHRSVLDLLHALLLTGSRDQFHVNVSESWSTTRVAQVQAMLASALLVLTVVKQWKFDPNTMEEAENFAKPGAMRAIAVYLMLDVQCALTWLSQTSTEDGQDLQTPAGFLGQIAIRALDDLGPLVSRHLSLPPDQSAQVLMSALAAIARDPTAWQISQTHNPLVSLLELLAQLAGDKSLVAAMTTAQGVPRLLHALARAPTLHSACAACHVLRAMCQHGPHGTHATFVACRGIQAMVVHLMVPPSELLTTLTQPGQQAENLPQPLCKEWLATLRFSCQVFTDILVDRQLAPAQQLWGAVCVALPSMLRVIAISEKSRTLAAMAAAAGCALKEVMVQAKRILAAHGCETGSNQYARGLCAADFSKTCPEGITRYDLDFSPWQSPSPDEHAQAQSPVNAATVDPESEPAMRAPPAQTEHERPAADTNVTARFTPRGAAAQQQMGPSSKPRRRQTGGNKAPAAAKPAETVRPADDAAALAAADAAMQALLQEEEQERGQRPQTATVGAKPKSKKSRKGATRAAATRVEPGAKAGAPASPAAAGKRDSAQEPVTPQPALRGSLQAGSPEAAVVAAPEATPCPATPAGVDATGEAPVAAPAPGPAPEASSNEAAGAAVAQRWRQVTRAPAAAVHAPAAGDAMAGHSGAGPSAPQQMPTTPSLKAAAAQDSSSLAASQQAPQAVLESEAPQAKAPSRQPGASQCSALRRPPRSAVPPYMPQLGTGHTRAPAATAVGGGQPGGAGAAGAGPSGGQGGAGGSSGPLRIPAHLEDLMCCPITQEPMRDPVICADGHTYERAALEAWLGRSATSPLTGQALAHTGLTPNYTLRNMIEGLRQL